jgi:hypothetical protein
VDALRIGTIDEGVCVVVDAVIADLPGDHRERLRQDACTRRAAHLHVECSRRDVVGNRPDQLALADPLHVFERDTADPHRELRVDADSPAELSHPDDVEAFAENLELLALSLFPCGGFDGGRDRRGERLVASRKKDLERGGNHQHARSDARSAASGPAI